jgi:hypothetical protein
MDQWLVHWQGWRGHAEGRQPSTRRQGG